MSDQYVKLEEERRHQQKLEKDKKKKKQKKEKRGKHRRHNSLHTESDEDIAPAHHVDIITEEMPEVSPEELQNLSGQKWEVFKSHLKSGE